MTIIIPLKGKVKAVAALSPRLCLVVLDVDGESEGLLDAARLASRKRSLSAEQKLLLQSMLGDLS